MKKIILSLVTLTMFATIAFAADDGTSVAPEMLRRVRSFQSDSEIPAKTIDGEEYFSHSRYNIYNNNDTIVRDAKLSCAMAESDLLIRNKKALSISCDASIELIASSYVRLKIVLNWQESREKNGKQGASHESSESQEVSPAY